MAGIKISDATTTTPVMADMIPFARTADATARHTTITALETLLFDRAIVINDSGADVDTRIEGVGQANAMFVQGNDGFVGIGTGTPDTLLDVSGASSPKITIQATDNSSPELQIVGGTNADKLRIVLDDSSTQYYSDIWFYLPGSTSNSVLYFTDYSGNVIARLYADGATVWNEEGNDANFRVEAVGQANALFVQGSDGFIGMGLVPTANMAGLSIEAGLLTLKERALPTADTNYGKIWTENDNTLHFQDGAGTEYTIDITPV